MPELPFEPPVQKIHLPLFSERQLEVFMKREDLIHPFVSGNKWRKLKYLLPHAATLNKHHLVSFGGPYSNHLVALACAGATQGFKTSAFVRGEDVKNHMLFLCRLWGMNLHFVSREKYKSKQQLFTDFFGDDAEAFFIDEGGKGELAMKGCAEILHSISETFSHTLCAVGTGTTLAGLAVGAASHHMRAEGICVLKTPAENSGAIEEEIRSMIPSLDNWIVHHRFHRGGYAKTDEELFRFITSFAGTTGILLDQVYTGKMMMGVIELIQEGYFAPHSRLLLIHTGGLLGLLSDWADSYSFARQQ